MSASRPAPTANRRTRLMIRAAFVVANVAVVGVFIQQSLASSAFPRVSTSETGHQALGEADGFVPAGVTVFDDEIPAVANLDADLLVALRKAATDARRDGVEFFVNSGWRSAAYQEKLLRAAVSKYGSEEEAARWVATPSTSPHVSGHAIDLGRADATAWLSEHGARYGLCQIYDNEPWHYELRPEAVEHGCPPRYPDPAHDPRMTQ
ncbi:M15 family metallopeptidase [Kribbella sp. NPDC050124]|uniref:M15 family metallopeptidase n=1 Tax=Kribbella sp. NPDC050124 TaxID=3364114 RepID=UPI003796ED25